MYGRRIDKDSKLIVYKKDESTDKTIDVNKESWETSLSLSTTNTPDGIRLSGADGSTVNWNVAVYLPQNGSGGLNYNSPRTLTQKFNDNLISFTSSKLNGSSMEYQLSDQLERINITLGDVHQLNSDKMYTYFRYDKLPESDYWKLECPLTVKAIAKPWTISVTPSYSITPYFLLKGTNEEGNSVYVSRFG